jgi:hypothetical protein
MMPSGHIADSTPAFQSTCAKISTQILLNSVIALTPTIAGWHKAKPSLVIVASSPFFHRGIIDRVYSTMDTINYAPTAILFLS